MHNYSFNDNDDDIFDDEQTLLGSQPKEEKAFKEVINNKPTDNELKDLIDSLSTDDDDDDKPFSFVASLSLNFYEASVKWVASGRDDQFKKALHSYFESMNKGTQKNFSYYEKYYTAQSDLAMRRVVSIFLGEVVSSPEKVAQLINKLGSKVDPNFVTTYFASYFNINQFTILECFSHYKALAQYLDLPFDDSIMKDVSGAAIAPIDYDTFSSNQFSKAVIDDEELKAILAQVLSESINKFVRADYSEDLDI